MPGAWEITLVMLLVLAGASIGSWAIITLFDLCVVFS